MSDAFAATHSKDLRPRDRNSNRMIQNVLLIWLDPNIDENDRDWENTINPLRRVVTTIKIFADSDRCMQFLEDNNDEKACMIIPGFLGKQIMPRVHNLAQVDSIFIFCSNRKYHETWTKDWSKIKGVFTEMESIRKALKQVAQQCEQNAISISIMSGGDSITERSGNRLDPSFMYTQIMKEILLTINFEHQHIDEFINHCRELLAGNGREIQNVNQFARDYRKRTPIWWYTYECFLYPMLNRALRVMDADLMVKMGFFISDLHHHIEQLHQQQFGSDSANQRFTVYRGQGMDKDVFQKMMTNKGGLISFNSFLSTSKNQSTSLCFAQGALTNAQLMGVLFVMNIDCERSNALFASVVDVGYYGAGEEEILFSMHTVFRIGEITVIGDDAHLMQVQLTLVSDKDNDLRELIDYMRKETFLDEEGWYRLGLVLRKMGELAKAQQVYERLLKQETDEGGKAVIYGQLGVMKYEQGEYDEAIRYYEKSVEIREKQVSRNDVSLAPLYNNIGGVYYSTGDYSKALSSYERAFEIQQQSLSPNHPSLAMSYNNMGSVYERMGDHRKALSSYEKAMIIQQKSLPATHPNLAMSYNNIGNMYCSVSDYEKALLSYEKALAIRHQSLPPTHPDLATSYNNIGSVYKSTGDYSKALSSCEKALTIQQQSLPSTHPDLAITYGNMGLLHEKIGNYSQAHSCFERALNIAQDSLPANHPEVQQHQYDLARIKKKL